MDIQWYPGHMTKTRRMMEENLKLVDIVIEILDARIPLSSKNPEIDSLAKNKFRIIVLNKVDLADDNITEKWKIYFEEKGFKVVLTNSVTGKGIQSITTVARELMKEKIERQNRRGRIFVPIRSMIVGIPNVGKSTIINKYVGKAITKTGNRPGVTRAKQWVTIKKDFELLDTPGILWPKFDDKNVALRLAFTGAIKDDLLDTLTLASHLIDNLIDISSNCLSERYGVELQDNMNSYQIMEKIGEVRCYKKKENEIDIDRVAGMLIDEFRASKLGRISLELPIVNKLN